jgi:C-terminal peptidase prc
LWLGGWFLLVGTVYGSATTPPPASLRTQAARYEADGQWDHAASAYVKWLLTARHDADARARLLICLRHVQQIRRHRDPAFAAQLKELSLAQAVALYAELLDRIQEHYADRDRTTPAQLFRAGLDELDAALTTPVFVQRYAPAISASSLRQARLDLPSGATVRTTADARRAARSVATQLQTTLGIPAAVVVIELACGAAGGLDEYSALIPPGRCGVELAGHLNGLWTAHGFTVTEQDGQMVVARVRSDSWAEQAGVLVGDRLERVGSHALEHWTAALLLDALRADLDAALDLELRTRGQEPRALRLPPTPSSVAEVRMHDADLGYIRLTHFDRQTPTDFDTAMLGLRMRGLRALVLDLRGNPGGQLAAALQIAERWGGASVFALAQTSNGGKPLLAHGPSLYADVPVVVLVDEHTASAAEVLAAAFKEQRALLVGQPTFGKGSAQGLIPLHAPPGAVVRLTLARLLTARGQPLAPGGITPQVSEPQRRRQLAVAFEHAARQLGIRP